MTEMMVTFSWAEACGKDDVLILKFTEEALLERDPESTSLVASKARFTGNKILTMSPTGPAEDEYMSPALIQFVFNYIQSGTLDVLPEIEADDAERALAYFGFPNRVVVIPETDPFFVGKTLAYKVHLAAMKAVPDIVSWIKKTLLSDSVGGAGVHLVVDDKSSISMNQFGERVDVVIDNYNVYGLPAGASVMRLGALFDNQVTPKNVFRLLGNKTKTSAAARDKILNEVKALGGIGAKWASHSLELKDVGEYGNHEYVRGERFILQITLDDKRVEESTEGIKRRKVMATE